MLKISENLRKAGIKEHNKEEISKMIKKDFRNMRIYRNALTYIIEGEFDHEIWNEGVKRLMIENLQLGNEIYLIAGPVISCDSNGYTPLKELLKQDNMSVYFSKFRQRFGEIISNLVKIKNKDKIKEHTTFYSQLPHPPLSNERAGRQDSPEDVGFENWIYSHLEALNDKRKIGQIYKTKNIDDFLILPKEKINFLYSQLDNSGINDFDFSSKRGLQKLLKEK